MHAPSHRKTVLIWITLTLAIAAWSINNILINSEENNRALVENISLQSDVVESWAASHARSWGGDLSLIVKPYQVDVSRTILPLDSTSFNLVMKLSEKTITSRWQIDIRESGSVASSSLFTEKNRQNRPYYKTIRAIPNATSCALCHGDSTITYSVTHPGESDHQRSEIIGVSSGYLLLLALGVSLSLIYHNRLLRNSKSKRIYEHKLHEQNEAQRAISNTLILGITNKPLKDKLLSALNIVTSVSWLNAAPCGVIFTTKDRNLVMAATMGMQKDIAEACSKVHLGECLCGKSANSKLQKFTPHTNNISDNVACKRDGHGQYFIPMIHKDEVMGLLTIQIKDGRNESADEIKFLTTIGNILGGVIHKNRIEEQLRYDAHHDKLTGLANRALLSSRGNARISRSRRDTQGNFCLLFIDLDRFKYINDSLGHFIGDNILIEIASRLRLLFRECDTLARLGGDEFVILLDEVENIESVYRIAERIHNEIEKNIHIDTYDLHTTCSIGIAYHNNSYSNFEHMLRDADIAMYRAKSSSSDKTITFDQTMHHQALQTMSIETELRLACTNRDLIVYFQPIHSNSRRRFIGAEALVRWNRNGIMTPPDEFIRIAEESGIITILGQYVLQEACTMIKRIEDELYSDEFYISVNISTKQMLDRNLINVIDTVLEKHATPTKHLRLEITESLFADNSPLITKHINAIKERGIKLLIDDFGTGYSSLSFLHNHPFDCVKIDRSFISRLSASGTRRRAQKMVKTITQLAHNLDMSVIAEGVEDDTQLNYLQKVGCDLIQGYLFSRPLDPDIFLHTFTNRTENSPEAHPAEHRRKIKQAS